MPHTYFGSCFRSPTITASSVGRTALADLGDDVMEELVRDLERELDNMADELQTVTVPSVELAASLADGGCSSGEDLRRALDDQDLRALFEELESPADGEGAVATTVAATAPTKPPIDPEPRGRSGRSSARTRRGHEKRRKRRRPTPRRTPSARRGRSRSESRSRSTTTGGLARHRRPDAAGRSAAGACRSAAAPRHRSRAASKSAPSSAIGSLGAKGTATRVAKATTSTAAVSVRRRAAPHGKAGGNAGSTSAVQQQQQQQQRMRYGGVGDHRGSHRFRGAAAVSSTVAAAGTGDVPKRGSEGSPLRRLRGVLISAAIVAALSTTVSGRGWPCPLVLVAVPLVHASVAWMANTVRSSSRYDSRLVLARRRREVRENVVLQHARQPLFTAGS
ncbi:unnamed protein product [Laminaria digitata]